MQVTGVTLCRPMRVQAKPIQETGARVITVDVEIGIHQEDATLFGVDLSALAFSTTAVEQISDDGPERTVHLAAKIVPGKRLSFEPHMITIGNQQTGNHQFRGTPRIVAIKPDDGDASATVDLRIESLAIDETNATLLHEIDQRLGVLQSITLEPCQLSLVEGGRDAG